MFKNSFLKQVQFVGIGKTIPYNEDFTVSCKCSSPDIDDYVLLLPFRFNRIDDYYNRAFANFKNFDGCVLEFDFKGKGFFIYFKFYVF